ncbi:hypothetical protein MTO96_000846 [Rhipicephalus appendiculatus]
MAAEPEQHGSHSFNKPDSSPKGVDFGKAVVFGVVMAVIVLCFIYMKPSAHRVDTAVYCCPDVLQQLFSAANFSVDPCYSFFGYTCYAFIANRYDATEPLSRNTGPLDGFPVTQAGKAVAAYYRACVFSAENDSVSVGRSSADAVISVTNPIRGSNITPQALVTLMIDLSLRFGLPSVVHFEVCTLADSTMCLNISLPTLATSPEIDSPTLLEVMTGALEQVNKVFSLAVQIRELQTFLEELDKLKSGGPTERYTANILTDVTSAITASRWKELLADFNVTDNTTVYGVPVRTRATPERRLAGFGPKTYIPLLLLDKIEEFVSPSQDAAIRSAHVIIVGALLRKAISGMESEDFNKLRKMLEQMRIVLPSDLFPSDLSVPTMTSDYAHAELMTRAYAMRVQRQWTFVLGMPSDYVRYFRENRVIITGDVILVPTPVYTIISLSKAADRLVLMPTVGVYFADSLWQFVFQGNWSGSTNATLQSYRECIQKNSRSLIEWPSELLWLSVQTSYEASSVGAQWSVDTGAGWRLTRAELFYMDPGTIFILPGTAQQVLDVWLGRGPLHVRLRGLLQIVSLQRLPCPR